MKLYYTIKNIIFNIEQIACVEMQEAKLLLKIYLIRDPQPINITFESKDELMKEFAALHDELTAET